MYSLTLTIKISWMRFNGCKKSNICWLSWIRDLTGLIRYIIFDEKHSRDLSYCVCIWISGAVCSLGKKLFCTSSSYLLWRIIHAHFGEILPTATCGGLKLFTARGYVLLQAYLFMSAVYSYMGTWTFPIMLNTSGMLHRVLALKFLI